MDSAVRKALKRFNKNKPYLKCDNCGLWKNIEKPEELLFKNLGYYSCFNCGKILKKKRIIKKENVKKLN